MRQITFAGFFGPIGSGIEIRHHFANQNFRNDFVPDFQDFLQLGYIALAHV
jgi:hypothetical protein